MLEQPGVYPLTVRFSPEIRDGLAAVRERIGVGPTDYIRLAVWRALQADAVASDPPPPTQPQPGADTGAERE